MKYRSAQKVKERRVCVGCGACVPVCQEKRIRMMDVKADGLRPRLDVDLCGTCDECVCLKQCLVSGV